MADPNSRNTDPWTFVILNNLQHSFQGIYSESYCLLPIIFFFMERYSDGRKLGESDDGNIVEGSFRNVVGTRVVGGSDTIVVGNPEGISVGVSVGR